MRKQMVSTPTRKSKVRSRCVGKDVWTHSLCTTTVRSNEILFSFYKELSSSLNISQVDSDSCTRRVLKSKTCDLKEKARTTWNTQQKATCAVLLLPELSEEATWPASVTDATATGCTVRICPPGTHAGPPHRCTDIWPAKLWWTLYRLAMLQIFCAPPFAGRHPCFSRFTLHLGLCLLSSPACFLSCPCPHCYCHVF